METRSLGRYTKSFILLITLSVLLISGCRHYGDVHHGGGGGGGGGGHHGATHVGDVHH